MTKYTISALVIAALIAFGGIATVHYQYTAFVAVETANDEYHSLDNSAFWELNNS